MTRLVVAAVASVGLILFAAFLASRLLATRTRGISIRMQLFVALAIIIGTFAFGLGLLVIDRVNARGLRLAQQVAQDEASALSGILAGELLRGSTSIASVARHLEQEKHGGAQLRFELFDAAGRRLFPNSPDPEPGSSGGVSVRTPVVVAGKVVGQVRVTKPRVVVRRLLADLAPPVLVISLVLGAAAAVAAALIGRAIARPIERLTAFAERASQGERHAAVPATSGGREVDRLARSLDSMRRQIEGRPFVETFAADLSHELKNPVAAIRASAEVLQEGALNEPAEARRFVQRIAESVARIERLLGDLLALARIEARGVEDLSHVDLRQLVQSAVNSQQEQAKRIGVHGPDTLRVRGDSTWLARALDNLIGNAISHSPAGSPVVVQLERATDTRIVTVKNEGTVAERVRGQIFRRFVTTRAGHGGTGLGLSIVRAVAEAHGGRAELADPGPPTVVIRFVLPG